MSSLLAFTVLGLFTGAAYAIAASGLVLTYSTTRVFNIAHGAFGMVLAFVFWDFSSAQGLPTWLALVLVLGVVAPAIGWFIAAVRGPRPGRGAGQRLAGRHGRPVRRPDRRRASRSGRPSRAPSCRSSPDTSFSVGDAIVTAHQLITIVASVVVAAGLYLLLNRTRIGTAMRASVDNPELLRLFGGKPDQVAALAWAIGISLAGARRDPARSGRRPGLLRPHPAGHQRVRRRDARPAQEPAADLRRRDGARPRSVVRRRLPATLDGAPRPGPARRSRRCSCSWSSWRCRRRSCGSARSRASSPRRCRRCRGPLGWGAGLLLFVALLAGALSDAEPAAGRHRGDVRDRDAVAGAAHRLRRPRLAGPVHLRRRRRAGLRQARRAEPLRPARLGARRGRRRRPGRAAGAAADRPLPRAGHARLRRRSWTSWSSRPTSRSASTAPLAGRAALAPRATRSARTGGYVVRDGGLLRAHRAGRARCSAAASSAGC